jgi:hypothetical protein
VASSRRYLPNSGHDPDHDGRPILAMIRPLFGMTERRGWPGARRAGSRSQAVSAVVAFQVGEGVADLRGLEGAVSPADVCLGQDPGGCEALDRRVGLRAACRINRVSGPISAMAALMASMLLRTSNCKARRADSRYRCRVIADAVVSGAAAGIAIKGRVMPGGTGQRRDRREAVHHRRPLMSPRSGGSGCPRHVISPRRIPPGSGRPARKI